MKNRIQTLQNHLSRSFRPNRAVSALDSYIAYVERSSDAGKSNSALVFLHGNPTNSYLWRNIVNHLEHKTPHRLLCPDLIGQGRSGESSSGYDFFSQYKYLDSWFEHVVKEPKVILCLHDWGSALGFHWARLNSHRVAGIVHMESIVGPISSWDEFPASGRKAFQNFRETPGAGETMVLEKNFFVEKLLLGEPWASSASVEDLAAYRERFCSPGNRIPVLTWPRQIPIKGTNGPVEVIQAAEQWEKFLSESITMPKLFIPAEPGFFSNLILEKTKNWKNHSISSPVKGVHFIQEQSPEEISKFIVEFLSKNNL